MEGRCFARGSFTVRAALVLTFAWGSTALAWAPPLQIQQAADPARLQSDPIPSAKTPQRKPANAIPGETKTEPGSETNAPRALPGGMPNRPATPLANPLSAATPKITAEAATLKGIQPGRSTREDLDQTWGVPKEIKKVGGAVQQSYSLDPFKRVTVILLEDTVSSIVIHLEKPFAPLALAQQLRITDIDPVPVLDTKGKQLGQAYPERGILFGFSAEGENPQVAQVVLEPIDALPFVLRAEHHLKTHYGQSLADAEFALQLDANNGRAHWVRAEALSSVGDFAAALESAEQAAALEPGVSEHTLTLGKLLAQLGDYEAATREFQRVIATIEASDTAKARAYCQLGDSLISTGQDYKQALQHHMQAIKLAEPLASDERPMLRRAAKEILVDANLSVAHDIAWGTFAQQATIVPKWLGRASEVAEDLIAHDGGDVELRLRVSEQALAALAGIPKPPDAAPWISTTLELGHHLLTGTQDPARKQRLAWQLGVALYDAMQVCKARNEANQAMNYGEMASDYLDKGQQAGGQIAGRDYLLGRLYFSLGSICAVDREDHRKAVTWFDKAAPLLEGQPEASALVDPGQQGEAFVSMAVSYWEVGGREQAMRLTRHGVKLMEKAVKAGKLDNAALGVAYSNLSSMHQDLGDPTQARQYAEMAAKYEEKLKLRD